MVMERIPKYDCGQAGSLVDVYWGNVLSKLAKTTHGTVSIQRSIIP